MRFANVLAVAVLVAVFAAPASGTPYLVASDYQGPMRRVDPNTGATLSLFTDGWSAGELEVGADGLIYVSYFEPRMLMRLDPTSGTSVGTIAIPGKPRDITFGPDGLLYVAVTGNGDGTGTLGIFPVDPATQTVLPRFNTMDLGGSPIGIAFGPGGDLFVGLDESSRIVRIDGATGNDEGIFTLQGIDRPQSLAFGPDGDLFVGNQGNATITRYAPDGTFLGSLGFNAGNTQGLYFLPNGNLVWGRGSTAFNRYSFGGGDPEIFSTGYTFAHSMVLIPEPGTLAALSLLVVPALASRGVRPRR